MTELFLYYIFCLSVEFLGDLLFFSLIMAKKYIEIPFYTCMKCYISQNSFVTACHIYPACKLGCTKAIKVDIFCAFCNRLFDFDQHHYCIYIIRVCLTTITTIKMLQHSLCA